MSKTNYMATRGVRINFSVFRFPLSVLLWSLLCLILISFQWEQRIPNVCSTIIVYSNIHRIKSTNARSVVNILDIRQISAFTEEGLVIKYHTKKFVQYWNAKKCEAVRNKAMYKAIIGRILFSDPQLAKHKVWQERHQALSWLHVWD